MRATSFDTDIKGMNFVLNSPRGNGKKKISFRKDVDSQMAKKFVLAVIGKYQGQ